jgi:hypothetical protein
MFLAMMHRVSRVERMREERTKGERDRESESEAGKAEGMIEKEREREKRNERTGSTGEREHTSSG